MCVLTLGILPIRQALGFVTRVTVDQAIMPLSIVRRSVVSGRLSNISSVIWSSFVKMLVIKSQIALIRSLPVIRNLHHQCRHQA